MGKAYDDYLTNVRNQNSVETSVATAIQGLTAENRRLSEENGRLRREKGRDESEEQEESLADQIGNDHKPLTEAVMANTPASIAPPANEREARRREEDDRRRQEDEEDRIAREEEDPAHAPLRAPINTSTSVGDGNMQGDMPQDPTVTRPAEHGSREGLP